MDDCDATLNEYAIFGNEFHHSQSIDELLNDSKLEVLICSVKEHTCLWKASPTENSEDIDSAWSDVASVCETSVAECKNKWGHIQSLYEDQTLRGQSTSLWTALNFLKSCDYNPFRSNNLNQPTRYEHTDHDYAFVTADYRLLVKCLNCPALFTDQDDLNKHKENAHGFSCDLCGQGQHLFSSKRDFMTHFIATHHSIDCLKSRQTMIANKNGRLDNFLRSPSFNSETELKPELVTCSICSKPVLNLFMDSHLRRIHKKVPNNLKPAKNQSAKIQDNCTEGLVHIKIETPVFSCVCNREFSNDRSLQKHAKVHAAEPDNLDPAKISNYNKTVTDVEFFCLICNQGCKTSMEVATHMRLHKDGAPLTKMEEAEQDKALNPGKNKCSLCRDRVFESLRELSVHMRVHRLPKPNDNFVQCCLCYLVFADNQELQNHHRCVHGIYLKTKSTYKWQPKRKTLSKEEHEQRLWDERGCRECKKMFNYRRSLVNHMDLIHGVQIEANYDTNLYTEKENAERSLLICEVCGRNIQKRNMKIHLQTHEPMENTFSCVHCGKCFSQLSSLNVHVASLHSVGGVVLSTTTSMHIDHVHENGAKVMCQLCEKVFKSENRLRRHHSVFHLRMRKIHTCDYCGKTFKKKYLLMDHVNLHTKEKIYSCSVCSKEFIQWKQLITHLKRMKHGNYVRPPLRPDT